MAFKKHHKWALARNALYKANQSRGTHSHKLEEFVQPLTGRELRIIGECEGRHMLREILTPGLDSLFTHIHTPVFITILPKRVEKYQVKETSLNNMADLIHYGPNVFSILEASLTLLFTSSGIGGGSAKSSFSS